MKRERNYNNYIEKEKRIISLMLSIYCRGKAHNTIYQELCESCRSLEIYAHKRLDMCPFGVKKTACKNCEIHCYQPKMREQIRIVMRYAGPRMLWYAPIEAIKHYLK